MLMPGCPVETGVSSMRNILDSTVIVAARRPHRFGIELLGSKDLLRMT
jgi:hypothetical protein